MIGLRKLELTAAVVLFASSASAVAPWGEVRHGQLIKGPAKIPQQGRYLRHDDGIVAKSRNLQASADVPVDLSAVDTGLDPSEINSALKSLNEIAKDGNQDSPLAVHEEIHEASKVPLMDVPVEGKIQGNEGSVSHGAVPVAEDSLDNILEKDLLHPAADGADELAADKQRIFELQHGDATPVNQEHPANPLNQENSAVPVIQENPVSQVNPDGAAVSDVINVARGSSEVHDEAAVLSASVVEELKGDRRDDISNHNPDDLPELAPVSGGHEEPREVVSAQADIAGEPQKGIVLDNEKEAEVAEVPAAPSGGKTLQTEGSADIAESPPLPEESSGANGWQILFACSATLVGVGAAWVGWKHVQRRKLTRMGYSRGPWNENQSAVTVNSYMMSNDLEYQSQQNQYSALRSPSGASNTSKKGA